MGTGDVLQEEYCEDCGGSSPCFGTKDDGVKRTFATGATRDTSENKNEYSGFLSPLAIEMFGDYMTKHRIQSDGSVRSASNWKKGMPKDVYIESMFRHFIDLWKEHEGYESRDGIEDALCGLYFNIQGYMHEYIKEKMQGGKR